MKRKENKNNLYVQWRYEKHAKAQQREKGYTETHRIFIYFDSIAHN